MIFCQFFSKVYKNEHLAIPRKIGASKRHPYCIYFWIFQKLILSIFSKFNKRHLTNPRKIKASIWYPYLVCVWILQKSKKLDFLLQIWFFLIFNKIIQFFRKTNSATRISWTALKLWKQPFQESNIPSTSTLPNTSNCEWTIFNTSIALLC